MEKRLIVHEKLMFIMRVSILQIFIASTFLTLAHARDAKGQEILNRKISLQLQNSSLRQALIKIENIADVKFMFRSQLVPANELVSIHVSQKRLADVLDELFALRKIQYEADGNRIILTRPDVSDAETPQIVDLDFLNTQSRFITVTGIVTDELNQPVPGANILVKGTSSGTTTDTNGRFVLEITEDNPVLVISFIGYAPQEVAVGNQTELTISLQPDIASLNEVVVIGYGTQKKTDVISSISSVEGKDLNLRSMPNFEAGLQGLASGVSVQSQSGAPGAPVRILIRGANSISLTTEPLYIIDGMPISMGNTGVGSSNQSPMSLINQNDIASVQILKDAAATSIYGSRGSNGVILVTTKSGKKGEGSTMFNFDSGFSKLSRTPEDVGFANTAEWFAILDEAYANSNKTFQMNEYYNRVPLSNPDLSFASPQLTREQAQNINTNWYDELFRVGTFQSYNLSSMKGAEKTSFYFSGNYRKDNGVQKDNDLERFTVRSNLDFNPSENLTISSKLTLGYTKNNQRSSGITSMSVGALPWLPVHEPDNENRYYNAYADNAVAVRDPDNYLNRVQQYRALGGVSLNFKLPFVKGLSLRTEVSGDVLQSNRVEWLSDKIRQAGGTPQSAANQESITSIGLNYNAYATYDRTIGDDHNILMLGGVEATRSYQDIQSASGTGLVGSYQQLGSPTTITSVAGRTEGERYLLGYFGRANYKFKQRYLFGLSARRDGSSVFTEANRRGTFLAASAGWIISDENFMSFLAGKTFLKIRGSYGETGNQNLPPNLQATGYNNAPLPITYGGSSIQGVNGTVPINIGAQNLQWETTRSSDIGLDFGFFGNRLNGSIAYYNRLISKQLLQAPIPVSSGISVSINFIQTFESITSNTIFGNFGDMTNSGYELELHSVNIDKNDFRWTTDFNIGFNQNEIKSLAADIDRTGSGLLNIYENAISKKGEIRNVWFIADYAGVDPITGVPMIFARDPEKYKATGETTYLLNAKGERTKLPANVTNLGANPFYQEGKSGDPKYQGGITNTLQYKNIDFSLLISFSGGNYILDYDRKQATIVSPTHVILKEVYDKSWRTPGDIAKYPELRAGVLEDGFSGANEYHNGELYKGDFVRLRNVQVGYTLSNKVVQRIKMKSVRFYISGANLLTLTKYPGFDPEGVGAFQAPGFVYFSTAIPQLKTLTLGAELRF